MTKYKLVPVEPTIEMAEAACLAECNANRNYGEPASFSDIWDAMIAAAPAVQGEPAAYKFVDDWGRTKIVLGKETAEHWCPPGETITPLYTAPQPAEQQPELAKYQPCGCVICTCEHETQCQGCGAKHCGTHPIGQLYQQPAPDVTGLVEALERIASWPDGGSTYGQEKIKAFASSTLANYQKRGDL